MISGNPVSSEIDRTETPASASSRAVPPVEMISIPSSTRPRANSTMPVLSDTDSSARATCRPSGAGSNSPAVWTVCSIFDYDCTVPSRRVNRDRVGLLPGDQNAPGIQGIEADRAPADQPHRLREQLVFDRPQMLEHVARIKCLGQLDRALEDHRTAVDSLV